MMAYIVYADVDNEISNLGMLVPDGKEALAWVNAKIANTELEINGKLSSRYSTPVTSTSALSIVKPISLKLTVYNILVQNYTQEDGNVSSWVENYRRDAYSMLDMILDGRIDLDANSSSITTDVVTSSTEGVARTFTNGTYSTDGELISSGTMDDF
jgi:hypothetical protein